MINNKKGTMIGKKPHENKSSFDLYSNRIKLSNQTKTKKDSMKLKIKENQNTTKSNLSKNSSFISDYKSKIFLNDSNNSLYPSYLIKQNQSKKENRFFFVKNYSNINDSYLSQKLKQKKNEKQKEINKEKIKNLKSGPSISSYNNNFNKSSFPKKMSKSSISSLFIKKISSNKNISSSPFLEEKKNHSQTDRSTRVEESFSKPKTPVLYMNKTKSKLNERENNNKKFGNKFILESGERLRKKELFYSFGKRTNSAINIKIKDISSNKKNRNDREDSRSSNREKFNTSRGKNNKGGIGSFRKNKSCKNIRNDDNRNKLISSTKNKKDNNVFHSYNIFSKFKPKKNTNNKEKEKYFLNQLEMNKKTENSISNNNRNKEIDIENSNLKRHNERNKEKIIQKLEINEKESNTTNKENDSKVKEPEVNQPQSQSSSQPQSHSSFLQTEKSSNITTSTNTTNNSNSVSVGPILSQTIPSSSCLFPSFFHGKKIKCIHEISKTGLCGDEKKVNQDRSFIFRNFVNGFENIFFGVCDGHGPFGHEVAEYIKENLPMDLNHLIKLKKLDLNTDSLEETIIKAFSMENNSLLRKCQIDSNLSGSTCVSVIYSPYKLIVANLGDSRCVLGKYIDGKYIHENLSRDHTPSLPQEALRIKKKGGRIQPMKDDDGEFIGPLRVYMKDKDIPGLAMTRSFGDYLATIAGTICLPEVKEHVLQKEDKFLILASDGLFEYIDSKEVVDIVGKYYEKGEVVGCCEFLYKEAYRKWISEEEDNVDDITIILVFFED